MTTSSYLIDVRTPVEYSTGFLSDAINVEYQNITQYIVDQESAPKSSNITLYCRSGRRSGIAKAELDALGYLNVRDIGSFEAAKATLDKEAKLSKMIGLSQTDSAKISSGPTGEKLKNSTNLLVAGLRELDD